uniref:Bifunctional inhibitor/plant lipid transfer protein/seed storage helical domain-containing protein n=1 Tax=Ananas comosus var. bracteatus TaxID=296719 RepID=A0A6V7P695_ANACO|nr:unnamed protein product [Ananas comosus var. bracteatus]
MLGVCGGRGERGGAESGLLLRAQSRAEPGVTCLCEAIREGARLGVPVNVTKALALPSLCGLSYTPIAPVTKVRGPPNQSPASPPSTQPTPSPSTPPTSPFPAPSLPPTTSPSLPPFSPEGPSAPPPLSESPQAPVSPATSANSKSGAIELGFSVMALVVAFVVALFSYLEF